MKTALEELQAHVESLQRLNATLLEKVEKLVALRGPNAGIRRQMRELAVAVNAPLVPLEGGVTLEAKAHAAFSLATLVLQHLAEPTPVAVPVVSVGGEKEAC